MKHIDVTEEEYLAAVTQACEIVDAMHSNSAMPLSQQDAAIKRFIAAIYDTIVPCDVLEILMVSDARRRNMLLTLLVGRSIYGRPRHKRADDLSSWGLELSYKNGS